MEIREAFGVQHVHLIHKQHPGYQLGDTLVNVAVHHLVDLSTELVCSQRWRRWITETPEVSVLKQFYLVFLYL